MLRAVLHVLTFPLQNIIWTKFSLSQVRHFVLLSLRYFGLNTTGAGSGIGRVTARFLLQRGYKVFLTDSNTAYLEETCTTHLISVLPKEKVQNYQWEKMDVTQDADVELAVKKCVSYFGRIDVLMNSLSIFQRGCFAVTSLTKTTDAGINVHISSLSTVKFC